MHACCSSDVMNVECDQYIRVVQCTIIEEGLVNPKWRMATHAPRVANVSRIAAPLGLDLRHLQSDHGGSYISDNALTCTSMSRRQNLRMDATI
jgi:hypothetical protein